MVAYQKPFHRAFTRGHLRAPAAARSRPRIDRGSAIVTALVLGAVTAVIAASLLARAMHELRLANRTFYQSSALSLAEAGLEEGMFGINSSGLTSANGWTSIAGTTSLSKTIGSLSLPQGTGSIYIRVDDPTGSSPVVIAAGVVELPNQPKVVKQLRLLLAQTTGSTGTAIASKSTITFSNSTMMDSYDSAAGAYGGGNISDSVAVAAAATTGVAISLGSAQIYGYAATGGGTISAGSSGRVYGSTTPAGTAIDSSRVRTDYTASLTLPTVPTGTPLPAGTTEIKANLTLPRSIHTTPGANGRYLYSVTTVDLKGNSQLTINGPVDLIVTGTYSSIGDAGITINSGANRSLNLYLGGTAPLLSGAGITNLTTLPSNVTVYGTRASGQTITVSGKVAAHGSVFAPNAAVTLTGSAAFFGALVGNSVTVGTSGAYHYDLQLANAPWAGGGAGGSSVAATLAPRQWLELTAAPAGADTAPTATADATFTRDSRAPFAGLF